MYASTELCKFVTSIVLLRNVTKKVHHYEFIFFIAFHNVMKNESNELCYKNLIFITFS